MWGNFVIYFPANFESGVIRYVRTLFTPFVNSPKNEEASVRIQFNVYASSNEFNWNNL